MAVAAPCLKFFQSPTMYSTLNPNQNDAVLLFRSNFLKTPSYSSKLQRTRSYEFPQKHRRNSSSSSSSSLSSIRRVCSASFENSYEEEEEFSKKMEELSLRFQGDDEEEEDRVEEAMDNEPYQPSLMEIQSIEMKAKSLDLPLSLRMIKTKKKKLQESFMEVGENAYCSVKKAFSSMVFIIRELHSYTLQMREVLFYEDLQGILIRVQREMHASFVWLFQQVFSHTPTLMVYVMILLANFTVHSISDSAVAAAVAPPVATVEEREINSERNNIDSSSTMKTFTVTSGSKTTAVGGGNGGGRNVKPVGSGMDGDGWMNGNSADLLHRPIVSDGVTSSVRDDTWQKEAEEEEEMKLWREMVDEASRMKSEVRDEALEDGEILRRFVSPVSVRIESDEIEDYVKTEMNYQRGLDEEPNNVLLLVNYAQFLYLVAHDFDRAEEYFKRAVKVEPKDAEAYNKYANFLWQVRNDLWAAEETFLEAISADPSNSFYAANYAHFLWNTGGEDTCFPLDDETDA